MHIHGNPIAIQAPNFSSAELEQEIEARRAADTRRRLRKISDAIAATADATPEESLLINHWMGTAPEVVRAASALGGDEYRPSGRSAQESPADDDLG